MARISKNIPVDLSVAHDLSVGLIERLVCPPDKAQVFLRDAKCPGLRVRATPPSSLNPGGLKSYVFEAKLSGRTIRKTIGDVRTWTIEKARQEATSHRLSVATGTDPREMKRQALALEAEKTAASLRAEKFTLKALLQDYCDRQEALGRSSHKDARSIFNLHVERAWPALAAKPANVLEPEEIADMMRKLISEGKGRTANKLRSYLRAAFDVARQAPTKASIPEKFKEYAIRHNPAAETAPDETQNRSGKNPLTTTQLQDYWRAIQPLPDLKGGLLRLHLLTGGQRIEQLLRLETAQIGSDFIKLFDGKGRPGKPPRENWVPLTAPALLALEACNPQGKHALSSDGGNTHVNTTTLNTWAKEAAKQIPGFQLKRVRSGVETLLSSRKVSKDIRGRLQSHGIGGVQDNHYDGYDYLEEKREALELLHMALEE
jgi:integrase